MSARIQVGAEQNGRFTPQHELVLFEGQPPLWFLNLNLNTPREDMLKLRSRRGRELEDALLLIGLYIVKDHELQEAASQIKVSNNWLCPRDDLEWDELQRLYAITRNVSTDLQIVLTLVEGSPLQAQLTRLPQHKMKFQVQLAKQTVFE